MTLYVDQNAKRGGCGTKEMPFKKIGEAANVARAGDEVIVAPGVYREYVDPKNSGTKKKRIVYRSQKPGAAVITGAERVSNWTRYEGGTWLCRIPNGVFGPYNPYTTLVSGDWFTAFYVAHTGEVFLNDKSLYEASSLEEVLNPKVYEKSWDKEFSLYKWFCEQDEEKNETLIYANFHKKNPNEENVEVTVRKNCFFPSKNKVGYITLSAFKVCKAATQWAPPTAFQDGMVGPNWSKGWIIEDCEICHSKCSGISLGKYFQKGNDNKWSQKKFKDGTQTQRDCVCLAQIEGWKKEKIGSHAIRRCHIHHCGQTGIVGHLGGAFSLIEDCHIHHINNKQNLAGAEIGGIKMHAAIDVVIRRNHFHHCTRGLWLDWQAQGTRVSQNLFHHNTLPLKALSKENLDGLGEDIFIEVSHGPTLVDNNVLLSDYAMKLPTQGVALVHNFIAGSFTAAGRGVDNGAVSKPAPRYTPYHLPHRTEIAGFMTILHGDMRFYNNIFVQQKKREFLLQVEEDCKSEEWTDGNTTCGTSPFDFCPTESEWLSQFEGYCGMGSPKSDRYYNPLPVWTGGNAFFNGASPCKNEADAFVDAEHKVEFSVEQEEGGRTVFKTNAYKFLPKNAAATVSTQTLGAAFESEQKFENPDGSPIVFCEDFFGSKRAATPTQGPFEVAAESGEFVLWE